MKTLVVVSVCLMLMPWVVSSQTNSGEIGGVVRDESGGVLPGAAVVLTHVDTAFTSEQITDGEGRFFVPGLPVGRWNVAATLPGFSRVVQTGLELQIGQTLALTILLEIGQLTEQVVVEARAPLLQTTNAEISQVVSNREVEQIPLNGRQFLQLAQLSDSVVIPPGGTRGAALQQAGPLPNVGGQRAGHNIYLLDGVKVTDELFNNLVINPSVDSIQEFKIQKTMYPPEFGGKASALINVSTKTGTNQYQGSGFTFVRDEQFDAHNFFDPKDKPVPPLDQRQYGGTFGGPIVRDRTFMFLSYEGQRMDRSLTQTFSVPSAAVRTGLFHDSERICDPLSRSPIAGTCGSYFPGNQIPAGRIDPVASAFLERVPQPNASGEVQNLTAVGASQSIVDQFSIRVDHRFGASDRLFLRLSTFDANDLQPFGTSVQEETLIPGFGRRLATKTRNLAVSYTRPLGTSMLSETRFGWMNVDGGQSSLNRGIDFSSAVNLQGVTRDLRDVGYPQFDTGGLYSVMGDPTSFISRQNEHFEIYQNLLIDRGSHRIKFGGYWFHLRFRPENADTARGRFLYTGQFSGNAFADFLLGYPVQARSGIGGRGDENARTNWLHFFVQDDWRLGDRLTVNLGLRYEINQHMYDVDNRLSSIDFSVPGGRYVIASDKQGNISPTASALLPLMPIPWVTSSEIGWDRSLLRPSKKRFAPRIGFAYVPDDSGRTVIRGGYGVFLNQWAYSVQTAFTQNLPFFFLKQVDVPSNQFVPSFDTRTILSSDPTGSIGGSIMDHDYQVEYTQTWTGGIQRELTDSSSVELFYMGSHTTGADNSTVRNVPVPGAGYINVRREIPSLAGIRTIRFDGYSIYHALTLKLTRRFYNDLSFNTAYTLSRSQDDASSPGPTAFESNAPQDVRNIFPGEVALSSFDHRHQFVGNSTYELPFLRGRGGWLEDVLGNWRVSGVVTVQSGAPFTVNLTEDRANIGAGPAQRPNLAGDPNLPRDQRSPEKWFDTDAFSLQAPLTFGSAPRNAVFSPGLATVDMSLQKRWLLAHGNRIEFRWEIFNLLNRANFNIPNRFFGNPNFGRIFSALNAREMQFGFRYVF